MTTPREQATTQTSATVSPIERAIAEADEACPCRHADGILLDVRDPHMCEKMCVCVVGAIHDHLLPIPSCLWPGHAAIRNLARVVLEEAGYQTGDLSDRARIRALMPEEVKQHE